MYYGPEDRHLTGQHKDMRCCNPPHKWTVSTEAGTSATLSWARTPSVPIVNKRAYQAWNHVPTDCSNALHPRLSESVFQLHTLSLVWTWTSCFLQFSLESHKPALIGSFYSPFQHEPISHAPGKDKTIIVESSRWAMILHEKWVFVTEKQQSRALPGADAGSLKLKPHPSGSFMAAVPTVV